MSEVQANVIFCMEWMPSYRRRFYEVLEPKLLQAGVSMKVIHGLPPASRSQRRDHSEPDWGLLVENRVLHIKGVELTWQPVWKMAKNADLIVVQQEASHLFNYFAMARRRFGGPKVALWGHGENPDPQQVNPIAEKLKRTTTPFADWCFAYTERSAAIFESLGIPSTKITAVNNSRSHDNKGFEADDASPEIADLCSSVAGRTDHVGWIASALDESKRLTFLVETLDAIRALIPDFEFFVLGRGPHESTVFEAAASRPWLHAVGARFGADKVAIGDLASVMVHPGLLGLHVIDSFAFETPIVTTQFISHSHEIDYLTDDQNARILDENAGADELACATKSLFDQPDQLARLEAGCRRSGEEYSLEHMTDRFAGGILDALGIPRPSLSPTS